MKRETKLLPYELAGLEVKATEGKPTRVLGYGSTFGGSPDSYGDLIAAGAYAKTIREWNASGRSLPMLWQHDTRQVIGKWTSLREDARGLLVDGELTPNHRLAEDVTASLMHGAVTGLSIGFITRGFEQLSDGNRVLKEIELLELSIVTMPANDLARITGVKSAAETITTVRAFEAWLREEGGYSHSQAKAIASRGFVTGTPRDEGNPDPAGADSRDEGGSTGLSRLLSDLRALRAKTEK